MEPLMGIFSPMVGDILTLFAFVVSVLALVAAAYALSTVRQKAAEVDKVYALEAEVKKLRRQFESLRGAQTAEQVAAITAAAGVPSGKGAPEHAASGAKAADGGQPEAEAVWSRFVTDYNNLSASMDVPRAEEACQAFVDNYQLRLLRCTDHDAVDETTGDHAPKFTLAPFSISAFWAWQVPEDKGHFVVVPNPLRVYGEKAHAEGGMKETFASNYEAGKEYHRIQVRLPALLRKDSNGWHIEQPGVIRLKE
ncbi:MAG: hypothetical protein SOV43_05535 [Selenomonadaceae bacterium]|nr:hypothetical protein [Selenomonadaceae bacterium]MDY2685616.1 hypothetical protein [Selenomonadaceae bacterium]